MVYKRGGVIIRKIFIVLIVISCILLQITGCTSVRAGKSKNENKTIEAAAIKSENDIREIAYKALSEDEKKTVISYKDGKVEQYKSKEEHSIFGPNGLTDIKDKDTYKITFRTNNEGILGPINIYIDKNSYSVLGVDLRD